MSVSAGTLLLVGEHAITKPLRTVLERAAWSCHVQADAFEAGGQLDAGNESIDLMILDAALPGGDVWMLINQATAAIPPVPVIVIAPTGDEGLVTAVTDAGAADCLLRHDGYEDLLPNAVERALLLSRSQEDAAKLAAIVGSSPTAIYSCDADGLVDTWNPAAASMTGLPAPAVLGRPLPDLFPAEERVRLAEALGRAGAGNESHLTIRRLCHDGQSIPVDLACAPIVGPQDQAQGVAVVELDARQRLRAEQLMARSERLGRINEELEQFAAVAAHDLQSPLRTVSLQLDLLAAQSSERLDNDDQQLVAGAMATLKRSIEMVERMLDYAREASVDVSTDTVVPADLARADACTNLAMLIQEHRASIECGALPSVICDHGHLVRVFQNLISNAIKYSHPDRDPKIVIRAAGGDQEQAMIDISDNGRGIPVEDREGIFVLFHRREVEAAGGSGIGLAVCRKLLEARDGGLDLLRSDTRGSTFRLRLPRATEAGD